MINTPIILIPNMLLLFFFLLSLPILLFLFHKHKLKHQSRFLPPGPPRLPIIGNLHQLLSSGPPPIHLRQLSKQYGPLMSLRLGLRPAIVVSSAKMAKEVMKAHDRVFSDRPPMLGQYKTSYNGLDLAFSRFDEYNKNMKKICVHNLLSVKKVQSFRSIREEEVSKMITNVTKRCELFTLSGCSRKTKTLNQSLNFTETVMTLASTIISRAAFGKSYEDEGSERSRFHGLINEAEDLLESFAFSDCFPLMGWVDRLTGKISRLDKSFKECDMFYQEVIDDHLDPKRPKPEQEDFVDALIRLRKDRSLSIDITFDHIKAILMDMFVGGSYPSAATMVSTMTELIKNTRVMNKVQEEIRGFIGSNKLGFVNEDDLQRLPYLKAVVKEALRLHPPIPLIPRETNQKCTISGYEIEPQTLVLVNAWAIGRDPESWENPEEFYPERFFTNSIDFRGQNFELIPFGAGRRICPGMHMGYVNVELALANFLYSYDWELPQGMKMEDMKSNALCLVPRIYDGH